MDKKNNRFLVIILLILLVILGLLFFYENKDKEKKAVELPEKKINLLKDYSRFYTVDSCVYKYINLITSNKINNLLNVIDKEYLNSNNITKDNLYKYINKLEGVYSFKSKKIYFEEIDKNYVKYYVYGYLIKEKLDSSGEYQDYYLIVNLDLKNNLFSVIPYNGEIFKEEAK